MTPVSSASGWDLVGIDLTIGAKRVLLADIPANSQMCEVWLIDFVRVDDTRLERRCLFVIPVYSLTNCSSPVVKEEFHWQLPQLLRLVLPANVVVGASDFETRPRYLAKVERQIGGPFVVSTGRTDNRNRLI